MVENKDLESEGREMKKGVVPYVKKNVGTTY
jgi:hypothetical protein